MCGRFFLARRALEIAKILGLPLVGGAERWVPRWNIAPTQDVLVATAGPDGPVIEVRRWGLIPVWAKDATIGNRMINARVEGIESKPAYGKPFKSARCVILADGFYEWKKTGSGKVPHAIRLSDPDEILGLAGLEARWKPESGDEVCSCTIITRPAAGAAEEVHERMPAILPRDAWETWVDRKLADVEKLLGLLKKSRTTGLKTTPLTTLVNSPRNDSADLLKPA